MKDRLRYFMAKEGLTAIRFAEIIGVQSSSISHILSGRNKPSFDFIESFLDCFPNINPDWLILGKGNMYRMPENTNIPDDKPEKESLFTNITDVDYKDVTTTKQNNNEVEYNNEHIDNERIIEITEIKNSNNTNVNNTDITPVTNEKENKVNPTKDIEITSVITLYSNGTFKEFTKV